MSEYDEWTDPLAIGSVCDYALADLVIGVSNISEAPQAVVESWDRIEDRIDTVEHTAAAPYNVVEIKPGEPLGLLADMDGAVVWDAAGQESDSGDSSTSRRRKKGKEEWRPFARSDSLSPGGSRRKAQPRRMQSLPRTRVMPKIKTPLKDILHKQREREEEDKSEQYCRGGKSLSSSPTDYSRHCPPFMFVAKIVPAPRRKPKSYGMVSKKDVSPKRLARGSKGVKKKSGGGGLSSGGAAPPSLSQLPLGLAAEEESMPVDEGPTECEGMPLMVGPDGEPLAAVDADMTEEQLIAELKELDATQQAIAESGASGGRLSALDSVAAALAMSEVQERALTRLNQAAEIETRVRLGLEAIAASAKEVYDTLDTAALAAAAEVAAKVGIVVEPAPSVSKIGLIHEAIEQAHEGAAMYEASPSQYRRLTPNLFVRSSGGEDDEREASSGVFDPPAPDGGFFQARKQRSKHISESLLQLQEESRRLQEQSRLLQERAMEMQRQAGLATDAPEQSAPTPSDMNEAVMLQGDQDELEQQIQEALAMGANAVMESGVVLGPGARVASGVVGKAAPPISWSMPPKSGREMQHQHSSSKPAEKTNKVPANFKLGKKTSIMSPGPDRVGIVRNVSIQSPASATALRAAAAAEASRSGQPAPHERERLDSAGSVDNMPILPSWSDLVSSPLTSPLKIVRNPPHQPESGLPTTTTTTTTSLQWRPPGGDGGADPAGAVQSPRQQPEAEAPKPRRFLPSIDVDAIIRRRDALAAAYPSAPPPPPPISQQQSASFYGTQAEYQQSYYGPGAPPAQPAMARYMMQRMLGGVGLAEFLPEPSIVQEGKGKGKKQVVSARVNNNLVNQQPMQQPMMASLPPYGMMPPMQGYGGPGAWSNHHPPPAFMYGHHVGMPPPAYGHHVGMPPPAWGPSPIQNPGPAITARAAILKQKQDEHFRDVEGAVVGRINKQAGRGKGDQARAGRTKGQ